MSENINKEEVMTPEVSSAKGSHPTSLGWLDAVVVIVSEETGSISVALGGMLKRHLQPETLDQLLRNELISQVEEEADKPRFALTDLLHLRKKEGQDDDE